MKLSIDPLKTDLQQFFSDGLISIVGSGLSAGEGIPGMGALETHLNTNIPGLVSGSDLASWDAISKQLKKKVGLEAALLACPPTQILEDAIVDLTAKLIEAAELTVLEEVITGKRQLAFTKLLPHLNPQPNKSIPVITTNYDRLVEAAAELGGWGVESTFVGDIAGVFDPLLCRNSFIKDVQVKSKRVHYSFRNRITIAKPHGSLDWFVHPQNGPIRCQIKLSLPRLIITPGRNKYHRGYEIPFDRHREAANAAIDKAARILVIGYGFNDQHLETHLSPKIRKGTPTLILCRTLSENAKSLIVSSPNVMAVSHDPKNLNGFLFRNQSGEHQFDLAPLWEVGSFVDNILT